MSASARRCISASTASASTARSAQAPRSCSRTTLRVHARGTTSALEAEVVPLACTRSVVLEQERGACAERAVDAEAVDAEMHRRAEADIELAVRLDEAPGADRQRPEDAREGIRF